MIGKRAVANTILARCFDRKWPDSVKDVVLQPYLFSAFNQNDPNYTKYPDDSDPAWRDCIQAAEQAIASPDLWANHYHTVDIMPDWHDPSKIVGKIGRHVFLKF